MLILKSSHFKIENLLLNRAIAANILHYTIKYHIMTLHNISYEYFINLMLVLLNIDNAI